MAASSCPQSKYLMSSNEELEEQWGKMVPGDVILLGAMANYQGNRSLSNVTSAVFLLEM